MLPQQYCLRWKYHHSNLQTMFSQLLDRGCFCDVTLACEGQLIRAHRVVLCACSTFFDTVLTNYASERDPIIIMKDVTFADIKCLIEFMYKGEINVEHANLASLLKTADDLKIKGLAEVTWRDDDDIPPPPPTPQTEFHSPTMQQSHTNMYDYANSEQQQQQHLQQQHQQQSQRIRVRTPEPEIPESKASFSPKHHHHHHHHNHNHSTQAQLCTRIPGLPSAIPTSAVSLVTAASAATSASASASGINNFQHDTYNGPKRKRGRPPLDDAYDVFNVKKLTQSFGETNNNAAHSSHTTHSYGENSQSNNVDGNGVCGRLTQTIHNEKNISTNVGVAAATVYQQHIHKQRLRQKNVRPINATTYMEVDGNMESEWINSNMEGGGADENENKINVKSLAEDHERNHHDNNKDSKHDNDPKHNHDHDHDHKHEYENEPETEDEPQDLKVTTEMKEASEQEELRNRKQERRIHEKTPEKQQQKSKSKRKCSNDDPNTCSTDSQAQKIDLRKKFEQLENLKETTDNIKENSTANDDTKENAECEEEIEANIKVENGENLHKSSTNSPTSSTASTSSSSSSSAASHSSESGANNNKKSNQNLSVSSGLHHTHSAYGSYCPEGYMINEHGILMAHDFIHAPTAAIPTSSSTSSMTANGQHGEEYADIKMEEFNESELRLTSEEMTQWQDVIKMDDYLAKGRRPQFWEEPFTRRVLDAIKNKRLEMKKAARILGVSYGTLYGRYRETYGCLKHPYSNTSLRNSQSNALAIPSRFDIVWPSAKPGQLDIGKLRPKDLSELWTRPQI